MARAGRDALSVRRYGESHGSHSHEHFQVLVGLTGTLELEVEGRGQRINPGDGLIIAPSDRHDFEAPSGAACLVLDSDNASWSRCRPGLDRGAMVAPLAQYLAQSVAQSLAHSLGDTSLRNAMPLAVANGPALLLEAWQPGAPVAVNHRRAIDWAALRAWAEQHASTSLSVADFAGKVYLSSAQFHDRCREELDMTPMAWVRAIRLHLARQLRAEGLPVSEVARRCGYHSPSALTAAMRRDGWLAARVTPALRDDGGESRDDRIE